MELSNGGLEPEEFRKVLKGLYEKGRKMDWKVPEPEGQSSPKSKEQLFLLWAWVNIPLYGPMSLPTGVWMHPGASFDVLPSGPLCSVYKCL